MAPSLQEVPQPPLPVWNAAFRPVPTVASVDAAVSPEISLSRNNWKLACVSQETDVHLVQEHAGAA